jgi:hypothetical protein
MEIKGFIGPSNVSESPISDQERTVNLYLEKSQSRGASNRVSLYQIPGIQTVSNAAFGNGRAHKFWNDREFAIIGSDFIEIAENGVQTVRGAVGNDGLPGTISTNGDGGNQLLITSASNAYSYDLNTNILAGIAALAGIATMGACMDGFGLCLDTSTSTVYISKLNDMTTWDLTQFIQRSQAPDRWISMAVSNKYLYLFGNQTTEPWYNAGTYPIPFQPTSALMNVGIDAPWSAAVINNSLYWLGSSVTGNNTVYGTTGLGFREVSTFAMEYDLDSLPETTDAIGSSYDEKGHSFYILTFPLANQTWAWDETSATWCERGAWNASLGEYDVWRPIFHASAFGKHRWVDLDGTGLLETSKNYYTDIDGVSGIRWTRRAPALTAENERSYFNTFELDIEVGTGTAAGDTAPQIMLRQSNDGGKTWGSELWRSFGKLGEYRQRVRWTRRGSARRRVFEIAGSDPLPTRILGAWLK